MSVTFGSFPIDDNFFVPVAPHLEPGDMLRLGRCSQFTNTACKADEVWQEFARELGFHELRSYPDLKDYILDLEGDVLAYLRPFSGKITKKYIRSLYVIKKECDSFEIWNVLLANVGHVSEKIRPFPTLPKLQKKIVSIHRTILEVRDQFLQIRELNLKGCQLDGTPSLLFQIPSLKVLNLEDNRIRAISPMICTLKDLGVLSLQNNHISSMPEEMKEMTALFVVNLRGNPIRSVSPTLKEKVLMDTPSSF